MAADSGRTLASLAVDGGLSGSDLCMQIQADVSGIRVNRPAMRETTALGAAIAAGLATGVWKELGDLDSLSNRSGSTIFEPSQDRSHQETVYKRWGRAVEMSRGWVKGDEQGEA